LNAFCGSTNGGVLCAGSTLLGPNSGASITTLPALVSTNPVNGSVPPNWIVTGLKVDVVASKPPNPIGYHSDRARELRP
jgi:hypothetical protein